uniref:Tudor domain-containing protein n=1 Tax=Lutzomyia longipalpis TaxID=7200 RepID=A0A1B0CCE0_LUTLO
MLKLISELNKYINAAHTTSPKFYSQTIAVGGYFAPKVIHVVSPLDFYVMKAMDVPMYEEQMYAMDKYYNDRQEQRIYSPENKMPVAINHNGHWHRGEVTSVKGPLQVEVRLVDVGTVITVHLRSLRTLHSDFMKLSKGVIACSLAHVAPCEQNDYQWPREALETFCALTNSDNLELFVHSTHTSKRNTFNVTLYSVRKDKNISINAQLVQLEFATSTGTESVQVEFYKDIEELTDDDPVNATKISIPSTSKDTKRSFRINSKILNIINPGEFYVIFKHNMTLVDQVQRRIQNLMAKSEAPLLPQDWQIDDMCCVRVELPDDPVCEWRRAIVKDIDESSGMYDVFLVDAGVQVRVKKELTAPVPSEKLKATFFAAFLCHLSHIAPTAGSKVWPSSAIDKFKSYCNSKKFEGYAVTMVGRSVNNSIPVVLWGRMEEDDPLQPTIVRWKNINESLVKRGYAHLTEKFPATFDNEIAEMELQLKNHEFQQFIESLNKSSLMETAVIDVDSWESKLTSEITAVLEWKPAEPWKESIFLGVATYVDNNGIIHMYNVKNRNLLDKMRVIADEVLRETLPSPVEQFWAKNQPCMAKYQAEEKFFRGVVRRVDKENGQCLVQFVDYGNIEEVSFKDMRKNLLFGNIPIQSYRFKFVNLVPIKREEPWPCDVLDKMHAYTTGHECIAMLNGPPEDNGTGLYEMVSLRMGNIDLVDYLLQNDYAARALPETAATVVQCTQLECLKPDGKTKVKTEPPELDSISKYREYFNQKDIKEQTLLLSENDDFDEEESTDNSDYKEDPSSDESDADEPSPLGGAMKKYRGDDDEESTVEHFNPLYTSTEVPKGREMFPYLELDKDCRGFYGKTTELMSPLELYFCPEIESHTVMHTNMEKCLQDAAAWYTPVDKVNPTTAYLARYDEDGRWYRAIVNSDKIIEDEIYVRFVDYLNTEMVNLKYIKPLHENFQCIPLRNIHVRLADVKVNPRYHAIDAERELRVMLHQKRVYAKIVKIGSPHLVKLYADKDDENVIYQSLIDRRFFVSTGKN